MIRELTVTDINGARRSLREVARREDTSLGLVREKIKEAIAEMQASTDPQVKAKWAESPFADRVPSPEEFVAWCTKLVLEERRISRRGAAERNEER